MTGNLAEGPAAEDCRRTVSLGLVVRTWWPLAASWVLMGFEGPAIAAVVARLADPKVNLAAYGGVVFPVALVVEAPIIMLLAASTALSRDWPSYRKVRLFTHGLSACLTLVHALIAFTPLYYVVAEKMIGAPSQTIEPARLGLMIMLPWTWSIAYRRFNQGVLIRFGHSLAVGTGTIVRLTADGLVLAAGYVVGSVPGIVVAACAITAGVLSEAGYVRFRVGPVLRERLRPAPRLVQSLSLRGFLDFYLPLSMTSVIGLLASPIGSAAMSRMPDPLESLAVWPVVTAVTFLFRSLGFAYNEVVVALLDHPGSYARLRRFTALLSIGTSVAFFAVLVPPVADFWFKGVAGLTPHLADLAARSLWLGLPVAAMAVLESWYQGIILHSRRTRGITEAVAFSLLGTGLVLLLGVAWGGSTGLYVAMIAFSVGELIRAFWLSCRSRTARLPLGRPGGGDRPAVAYP